MRATDTLAMSRGTVNQEAIIMAITVVAFVYQVGTEIRASVVTRSVGTDAAGNDVIIPGHSNMAVSERGGTDTASLAKALAKIPAAKHLSSGHDVKELGTFLKDGTPGINNLFVVTKGVADVEKPSKASK